MIVSVTPSPSPSTTGVAVAFTPVVTGSVSQWEWNYEGGGYVVGTSTGQHIFNTAGQKQVSLRVTGPFGQQSTMSVTMTVNPKPAPTAPVAVPAGPVPTNTTVNLSSTDSGGRTGLIWDWQISNGVSTVNYPNAGPSISHLFATAGSWTVTVTATDSLGVSGVNFGFVTVQDPVPPLVAGFTHAATATPLQVQFTDTSTGPPIGSWSWDFGAAGAVGDTAARNPLVTYPGPGAYSVTLTVTAGAQVDAVTVLVTVS